MGGKDRQKQCDGHHHHTIVSSQKIRRRRSSSFPRRQGPRLDVWVGHRAMCWMDQHSNGLTRPPLHVLPFLPPPTPTRSHTPLFLSRIPGRQGRGPSYPVASLASVTPCQRGRTPNPKGKKDRGMDHGTFLLLFQPPTHTNKTNHPKSKSKPPKHTWMMSNTSPLRLFLFSPLFSCSTHIPRHTRVAERRPQQSSSPFPLASLFWVVPVWFGWVWAYGCRWYEYTLNNTLQAHENRISGFDHSLPLVRIQKVEKPVPPRARHSFSLPLLERRRRGRRKRGCNSLLLPLASLSSALFFSLSHTQRHIGNVGGGHQKKNYWWGCMAPGWGGEKREPVSPPPPPLPLSDRVSSFPSDTLLQLPHPTYPPTHPRTQDKKESIYRDCE